MQREADRLAEEELRDMGDQNDSPRSDGDPAEGKPTEKRGSSAMMESYVTVLSSWVCMIAVIAHIPMW